MSSIIKFEKKEKDLFKAVRLMCKATAAEHSQLAKFHVCAIHGKKCICVSDGHRLFYRPTAEKKGAYRIIANTAKEVILERDGESDCEKMFNAVVVIPDGTPHINTDNLKWGNGSITAVLFTLYSNGFKIDERFIREMLSVGSLKLWCIGFDDEAGIPTTFFIEVSGLLTGIVMGMNF